MLSDLAARELARSNDRLASSNERLAFELKRLNDRLDQAGGIGAVLDKFGIAANSIQSASGVMGAAAEQQMQAAGSMNNAAMLQRGY